MTSLTFRVLTGRPPAARLYAPCVTTRPLTSLQIRVRKRKRRSGKDDDCSDDDDNFAPASAAPTASDRHLSRRGKIRRQRLEMEQSRRDELRDSYLRLKDALPVSNTTPKALLLDRATDHIKSLELRVQQAENEAARLRQCVYFSSPSIAVLTLFFKAQ